MKELLPALFSFHRPDPGDAGFWDSWRTAPPVPEQKAIRAYLRSDRVPFLAPGYTEFKERLILELLENPAIVASFREGGRLPENFGSRLDERIVEYPWVFSRLPPVLSLALGELPAELQKRQLLVDAGSTLNKKIFLEAPILKGRPIVVATLETDRMQYDPYLSYLFTDLRDMVIRDAVADQLVCISTLEHVGFTYEYQIYSRKNPWPHSKPQSYLDAVREFRRVLKPGGSLLLTVPFGAYEDHGWLQQFDRPMIDLVKEAFNGETVSESYYRYLDDAWQVAEARDCADLSYFNIHETGDFEEDGLAAARAVCCLELLKAG